MENPTPELTLDKNDMMQLVIQSNNGTINIHNHINDNKKEIDAKLKSDEMLFSSVSEFIQAARDVANKFIELESKNNSGKKHKS